MFEVTLDLALMLMVAAFVGGFIDAIAGGGGLITVTALMLAGASPIQALSTNKLQAVFGAATSTLSYARAGRVNLRSQGLAACVAFGAGMIGAALAHLIPTDAFQLILPVILIAIAAFFAFKPGLSDMDRVQRITPLQFIAFVVPPVAAYDGLIGPGAGAFYMIGFVLLAGYGVLKATAHTKLLNFASNLGGLAVFSLSGAPWWITRPCDGRGADCGRAFGCEIGDAGWRKDY